MARKFDEVDDALTLADHSALTLPNGNWTVSVWVKLDDNDGVYYQYFISWGGLYANPSFNWYFYEDGHGSEPDELRVYLNSSLILTSSGSPGTSRTWQHLALVRSGTTVTQYVNGSADGSGSHSAAVDVADTFYIGQREDGSAGRYYGGHLAELAKWDRALSTGEIAALAGGMPASRIGGQLKIYIPMFGASSPEPNYAGTAVNAALVSTPTHSSHPPVAPMFGFDTHAGLYVPAAGGAVPVMMESYRRRRIA